MTTAVSRRFVALQAICLLGPLVALSCRSDRAVEPNVGQPSFAKGGPSGNPTVTSTKPSRAGRDTTLDVTVSGTGFDQGSRATWALDGDTTFAKTKVKTNSTTYVSGRQLIANITVSADATVDLYDVVVVTLSGRKGIGIELFAISVLTDLGALTDSLQTTAYDSNVGGTIVGSVQASSPIGPVTHAAKWTPSATGWVFTDLGPQLGTGGSGALGINASGDIVGARQAPTGESRGYIMSADGTVTDLGSPPGAGPYYTQAYDINANGEVVGTTGLRGSPTQPFYWSAATGMVLLPPLPGAVVPEGGAAAINDNGVIAGFTTDGAMGFAVRWERIAGVWTVTKLPSGEGIGPTAISNNGNIVGGRFFWPAGGAPVDIGTLGSNRTEAYGVDDAGRVVGLSLTKTGFQRAFSWTAAGGMKELPSLGGGKSIGLATAINNAGMIVGASADGFSPWHATLWMVP